VLVPALKAALQLPRPVSQLYEGAYGFAFPSSHAAMSLVIYGFLGVLLAQGLSPRRRWLVFGGLVPLIGLIAFSRVYLGAHWLSDVIGGLAFGTAWVALLAIAYMRHQKPVLPVRSLAAVSLLTLLAAGGLNIAARHGSDTERYAVREQIRALAERDWWNDGWRALPTWRLDMKGEDSQPLTVQWAGSLDVLRVALGAAGWQAPLPFLARNWLLLLDTERPAMLLPVLPRVHDGRNQALALIRALPDAADQRLVLRVWSAGAVLAEQPVPVWVGTVTRETIQRAFGGFNLPRDGNDYDAPRTTLGRTLAGVAVREVQRSDIAGRETTPVQWDGGVLLARPRASL
jgi:undecaprenyl-diphosphatase